MNRQIITAADRPDHHALGFTYKGHNGEVYWCESWEENHGYWLQNVNDSSDRRNVSERAIGRTFHVDWRIPQKTAL